MTPTHDQAIEAAKRLKSSAEAWMRENDEKSFDEDDDLRNWMDQKIVADAILQPQTGPTSLDECRAFLDRFLDAAIAESSSNDSHWDEEICKTLIFRFADELARLSRPVGVTEAAEEGFAALMMQPCLCLKGGFVCTRCKGAASLHALFDAGRYEKTVLGWLCVKCSKTWPDKDVATKCYDSHDAGIPAPKSEE